MKFITRTALNKIEAIDMISSLSWFGNIYISDSTFFVESSFSESENYSCVSFSWSGFEWSKLR